MIVKLREDLRQAQRQAEEEDLKFQVEEIDLELQVTMATEAEGKVGVNFWVYTAEAGGGVGRESAQTVRLKLKPCGDDLYVSDQGMKPTD
jgi:hypothetical protein